MNFHGEDLRKIYRTGETEVHALRGVDLDIEAGEVLGGLSEGAQVVVNPSKTLTDRTRVRAR